MSNNNNRMIVFASILGAILATSILALNQSPITNAGAQMYGDHQYGYDNNHQKKSSHTVLDDSNIYRVKGEVVEDNPLIVAVVAECDDGDTALNGNYFYFGDVLTTTTLINSGAGPLGSDVPTNWFATIHSPSTTSTLQVDVYCFDNPPGHMP